MRPLKALTAAVLFAHPMGAQAGDASLGVGRASYYGSEFAGRRTASGETFDPRALTAAHRTAAFGSRIKVTHLRNGKEVIVRVNDRGPWGGGRIIDLSYAAARRLDMHRSGTARVRLTLVGR